MQRRLTRRDVAFSFQCLLCLAVDSGVAWSQTWDGGGGNNSWGTADNWNPNGVPANNGTASLVFAGNTQTSPNVDQAWDINGLTFNNTAAAFTMAGSPLTIQTGGITNSSSNLETIGNVISLGSPQTWNAGGGPLSFGGTINLNGKELTVNGSSNIAMSGAVNDATIIKNGAGTLTLSGNADNISLGLTVNNGAVVLAKLSTSGIHSLGGGMTINGGTVQISNAVNTGIDQIYSQAPVTINGGTFNFNGKVVEGFNILSGSGGIITNLAASTSSTMVVGENNGSGTYSGSIQDGASVLNAVMAVSKSGTGTQTLGGANTYTGTTTITGGTLRLASATALGSTTGGTTVASGATLDLFGQTVGAESLTLGGAGVGGNGVLINSSAAPASVAGNVVFSSQPTFGGAGDITLSGAVNDATIIKNGAGTLTLSGNADNISLGLTVNNGAVVLAKLSTSGIHSLGGGMTINGGTVQISNAVNTGIDQIYSQAPVTINGGTFDFNGKVVEGFNILSGSGGIITNLAASTSSTMVVGENNGSGTYSGSIQDGASVLNAVMAVSKSGTGTQTLGGANTYTGTTTITGGTLRLASATALGSTTGGTTVASGATLDLFGQTVGAESLTLGGAGVGGNGVLINSSAAPASVAGNVVFSFQPTFGGAGDITLSGTVEGVSGQFLNANGSGTLTLSGSTNNTSLSVSIGGAGISGTVVLEKASSGSVHAVDNNLFVNFGTGSTTVRLGGTGDDQLGSNTRVALYGTFDFNGRSEGFNILEGTSATITNSVSGTTSTMTVGENNGSGTYSGAIQDGAGAMALTKTGTGTLTLGGTHAFSGGITINGGTLALESFLARINGAGNISIATNAGSSGTIHLSALGTEITQSGASSFTVGSNTTGGTALLKLGVTASGSAGVIVTTGTGTLTINKSGTVSLGSATTYSTLNANGNVTIDGGVLERATDSDFNLANGKTMDVVNGGRATFAGTYNTAVNGIYNVSGANSKLETTGIAGLSITDGSQINVGGGGLVSVGGSLSAIGSGFRAATLSVDGSGSMVNANGPIAVGFGTTGNGVVNVLNGATLTANAGLHIRLSGKLGGNGTVVGNVQNNGFVSPGSSAGTLTINGNYTEVQAPPESQTGTLKIELASLASYDRLVVNGAATFAGTLHVDLVGFTPAAGNSFDILDFPAHSGSFANLELPDLPGSLDWNTSQLYTTGVLSVFGNRAVGDYNGSGFVDAADYTLWRDTLSQTGPVLAADGNGNNQIDNGDYTVSRTHFGQTAPPLGSGASATAAVPEPTTLVLLMFAVASIRLRPKKPIQRVPIRARTTSAP